MPEGTVSALLADVSSATVPGRMKTLLQCVGKLIRTPAKITPQDAEAVLAAGWQEKALHDAMAVCGLFNLMNRLAEGLGIPAGEGYFTTAAGRLAGTGYTGLKDLLRRRARPPARCQRADPWPACAVCRGQRQQPRAGENDDGARDAEWRDAGRSSRPVLLERATPGRTGTECQPGAKMGTMSFRRLPAAAAQRAARLLPVPAGITEAQIRQAAWVARCVGRGQSAPLRPGDVTALASTLAVRTFPPGAVVFGGGQAPGVWIVRDGRIELAVGSGRRRAVIQLLRPGDVDGDIQLLLEMPLPYTGRALSEVTCLFLTQEDFEELLATRPAIARRWLSSVAHRLAASQARVLALLGGSLAAQAASLLAEEAVEERVELPQRTLAAMLGVQRPSLNKVLKDLERHGLIRISYSTIEVLDRARLTAQAAAG